ERAAGFDRIEEDGTECGAAEASVRHGVTVPPDGGAKKRPMSSISDEVSARHYHKLAVSPG
ncbi:hypothetical protein ABTK13_20640, partial [Acinetobacter baumannii]